MSRTDWILSAVVLLGAFACLKIWSLSGGIEILVHSRGDLTQSARTDWRESSGMSTSLTTWRDPRESNEEFIERHEEAVREVVKVKGREADAQRIERR